MSHDLRVSSLAAIIGVYITSYYYGLMDVNATLLGKCEYRKVSGTILHTFL